MPHWGKVFLISGATCAIMVGYIRQKKQQDQSEETKVHEREGSTLLDIIRPPQYTVTAVKISVCTTGAYLTWRLLRVASNGLFYYTISLSTLLLNYTPITVSEFKLGSIIAPVGIFLTTAYFLRSIGTELAYFALCNLLIGAPALYSMFENARTSRDRILSQLTNLQDSEGILELKNSFTKQNLEDQWRRRDPRNRGLSIEEVESLVDEIVGNVLENAMEILKNYFPEGTTGDYILSRAKGYVEVNLGKATSMLLKEQPRGIKIKRDEFLKISEEAIPLLIDCFNRTLSQMTSIGGAFAMAKDFNSIGY